MQLRSSFKPLAWPAVVTGLAAEVMALQRQLDASQWWTPEKLRAHQYRQLRLLLTHAAKQVWFHGKRLREAGIKPDMELNDEVWSRIPILTRRDVQSLGDTLHAGEVPATHGQIFDATSGGSSGVPVRVQKTGLADLLWRAIQVREELWHRRDPRGAIARFRRPPRDFTPQQAATMMSPPGMLRPDYGAPMNLLWETGPIRLLDDRVPIADQTVVLRQMQPAYLYTLPANLRLMLTHIRDSGRPVKPLLSVWTLSEMVDDPLRALCRDVFNCEIVQNYTSAEAGYMALQCPEHDHFHVQSEVAHLEVLRPDGSACAPGEIGKVVITPLHNFATPLLRYEIGDEAEVGEPCACGRGLPVLRRIVGRTFDYLTLPDGTRRRVDTGYYRISAIPAVREFQIAQRTLGRIELLLVLARPLTEVETATVRDVLVKEFGTDFQFDITVHDSITRTEAGKLRAFVSDLPIRD